VLFYKNNRKHFPMFTLSYVNTSASLGEREMCGSTGRVFTY
jgi:hypothetical protein